MTKRTFYRKLREVADKFNWYETRAGLRGYLKDDTKKKKCYCPITAVCRIETGKHVGVLNVIEAEKKLDFKNGADEILDGADLTHKIIKTRIGQSYISKKELSKEIRQANYLRKCVGLTQS